MKKILTIAGSDSGGGAGIQADLKTITVLGGYGMSAVTALTAQNTLGVQGVHPVPVEFIRMQMESVLSDYGADGAKTGMLATPEIVSEVAAQIKKHHIRLLVVDPFRGREEHHERCASPSRPCGNPQPARGI
jgi:hydroxymethylpyrimidine kinase/phosphomethylpyrimidine kinase